MTLPEEQAFKEGLVGDLQSTQSNEAALYSNVATAVRMSVQDGLQRIVHVNLGSNTRHYFWKTTVGISSNSTCFACPP